MNEWVLVGIVVVGTIAALGGGSWIMSVLKGGKDKPTSKE